MSLISKVKFLINFVKNILIIRLKFKFKPNFYFLIQFLVNQLKLWDTLKILVHFHIIKKIILSLFNFYFKVMQYVKRLKKCQFADQL
jgi:hypothetical protein